MKLKFLLFFLPLFSLVVPQKLWGQTTSLKFKQIDTRNGSLSNNVQAVYRDHYGFLWIGTASGLIKFDGHNFTPYEFDASDSTSIGSNNILDIKEDSGNNLWIATYGGGLSIYNRSYDNFSTFKQNDANPSSITSGYLNFIFEDSNSNIWLGSVNGLSKFNSHTRKVTRFFHDPHNNSTISSNQVETIYEDSKGNLWIGTGVGLDFLISFLQKRSIFITLKTSSSQST